LLSLIKTLYFEGLPVVLPRETDSVLVGSAILAALAAGDFKTVKVGREN
jgi:ribulose kinase